MSNSDALGRRGLAPLLLMSGAVVLVAFGFGRGLWVANLHNGLLGLAFTAVGTYVLFQRPGHPEGRLFLATGLIEAILFFGRQVGHESASDAARWLGWLGVWPTAVALGLTTLSVISYPDGRPPAAGWRWVVRAVIAISLACAATSAIWPVEYESAGVISLHPITAEAPLAVTAIWSAVAHPAYIALQLLWVVAVVVRFRISDGATRSQVRWLAIAAAGSVVVLLTGLAIGRTPVPGLLAAALVPVVAGWAIVHSQHAVAYSALSWLSRNSGRSGDLASGLAQTVAEALDARRVTLWVGADELRAVGVWPPTTDDIEATTITDLGRSPELHLRSLATDGTSVGALGVERPEALSLAERRLFDDLASQASLVIEHLGLAGAAAQRRSAGHLAMLTERERTVLELMARGLSNAAICEELHLSIKTIEPVVSTIFTKLGLHADARDNRRVLAVLVYLNA